MSNAFTIVISAQDKATATVRKVNDAVSRLTRPFDQVGKSFKSLGRELGFEKIGKNLSNIGDTAGRAARGIGSIVAPMAAITGVASVGGVIALADGWAKLGRSITYASQNTGVSTDKLQAFQGAAKLTGVSAEATSQSLQSLGETMQDALYGRNQQALMLFQRLGVGIKKTKDGAVDAAGEFKALAKVIYGLKTPQQQNLVAGQFGLTALLPLIRQGPAAMDRLEAKARELGLVMDGPALASANDFASALDRLKASGEGIKNSIGSALIPAIQPLVDEFSKWLVVNRKLISQKVGKWAREFADWIKGIDWKKVSDGIGDFIADLGKVVDALGGWKNAAIAVAVVMNANLIGSVVSLTASLVKGGVGLVAYIGQLAAAETAATGLSGALGAVGRAGLYGAAAGVGIYAGTKISDAMDGTTFGDKFSHYNTKYLGAALSLVGFKNNQFEQAAKNDGYDQKYNGAAPNGGIDKGLRNRVIDYFQSQGWTKEQAAGITANFVAESGLNPSRQGDNGSAFGIGQWHSDRQKAFAQWSGHDIRGSSLMEQARFAQFELTKGSEQAAGAMLRSAQTAGGAAAIVSHYYERPADQAGEAYRRGELAQSWLAEQAAPVGPYGPTPPPGTQGSAATSPNDAGSAAPGAAGKVHVEINLPNAPAGTQAKVKTGGDVTASTRIGYSAVGSLA